MLETVDAFWYGDVHANDAFAFLVDDRVDRDSRLACAAVADDEFALAAPDRDHGVNGLDARLQRLLHGLSHNDAGRRTLDLPLDRSDDWTESVDRVAECIHHAADQRWTDWHFEHAARAPDLISLFQLEVVAKDHRADVVLFEVQRLRDNDVSSLAGADLEHLAGHGLRETVDACNTILHFEDSADLVNVDLVEIRRFDLAQQNVLDLTRAECGFGSHYSDSR